MIKKISIILILTISASFLYAQEDSASGISFYAILGAKQVSIGSALHDSQVSTPDLSTSLGAGSYWTKNRYIVGTEFFYSAGNKEKDRYKVQYTGFNTTLYAGYKIIHRARFNVIPAVGLGIVTNKVLYASALEAAAAKDVSFNTSTPVIHTSVLFEKIAANGITLGLKAGYNISTGGKKNWEFNGTEATSSIKDNPGGFFIQLTAGGLMSLKGKKQ